MCSSDIGFGVLGGRLVFRLLLVNTIHFDQWGLVCRVARLPPLRPHRLRAQSRRMFCGGLPSVPCWLDRLTASRLRSVIIAMGRTCRHRGRLAPDILTYNKRAIATISGTTHSRHRAIRDHRGCSSLCGSGRSGRCQIVAASPNSKLEGITPQQDRSRRPRLPDDRFQQLSHVRTVSSSGFRAEGSQLHQGRWW